MTEKQFRQNWQISEAKLLKMAPFIEGARYCPNCGKWEFPENAKAIYIPDKREYRNDAAVKKYAYVLDAICREMELNDQISNIENAVVKTIVRELKKEGWIVLIEGKDDESLYHLDYILSIKLIKWKEVRAAQKRELILQLLRLAEKAVELAAKV